MIHHYIVQTWWATLILAGWVLCGLVYLRLDTRMGETIHMLSDSRHAPKVGLAMFIGAVLLWPIWRLMMLAGFAGYDAAVATKQWMAQTHQRRIYNEKYNTRDLLANAALVCVGQDPYHVRLRRADGSGLSEAWALGTSMTSPLRIIPDQEVTVDADGTFQVVDEAGKIVWVRLHREPESATSIRFPVMSRAEVVASTFWSRSGEDAS